jgi:hypothetical protein
MRIFFKFKLNRKLSREYKRPVWTLACRYDRQKSIRWSKGVHTKGLNKFFRFRPGTGWYAKRNWLVLQEDL